MRRRVEKSAVTQLSPARITLASEGAPPFGKEWRKHVRQDRRPVPRWLSPRKQKAAICAMSVFAEVLQYRPFRRVFPPAGAGRSFPAILTGPVRNAVAPPSS